MSSSQHLSDEAVAAFADGVLTGHARERAARHTESCRECRQAVAVQREAAWALRAAPAPALPIGLFDRLRNVPQTTPLPAPQTVLSPDGTAVLPTFAPMAAFVPASPPRTPRRARPYVTTAAVVALAGALTAGSVAHASGSPTVPGTGHGGVPAVYNVNVVRHP